MVSITKSHERGKNRVERKGRLMRKTNIVDVEDKNMNDNEIVINYADIIEENFKEIEFNYLRREKEDEVIFMFPMHADNAPGLNVKLIVDTNGDCKFICYVTENVSHNMRRSVAYACNQLNTKYRYIVWSIDEDGDVCATYDFALFGNEEVIAGYVLSILFLCADVTDKGIPTIMKEIWNESGANLDKINMQLFQVSDGGNE